MGCSSFRFASQRGQRSLSGAIFISGGNFHSRERSCRTNRSTGNEETIPAGRRMHTAAPPASSIYADGGIGPRDEELLSGSTHGRAPEEPISGGCDAPRSNRRSCGKLGPTASIQRHHLCKFVRFAIAQSGGAKPDQLRQGSRSGKRSLPAEAAPVGRCDRPGLGQSERDRPGTLQATYPGGVDLAPRLASVQGRAIDTVGASSAWSSLGS